MLTRTVCAWGLVLSMAGIVNAEAVITYESFDDQTPGDSGIVLGEPGGDGDSATVEIWLTPTDGIATTFGAGGYEFSGTNHGDGSVTSPDGGITSSDHLWAEPFQNQNAWFTADALPNPQTVSFFPPGEPVPLEGLLLGTLVVTANNAGMWEQPTNPIPFFTGFLDPILLAPGSEFYTVTVLPEPTTAMLFGLGLVTLLRRRR